MVILVGTMRDDQQWINVLFSFLIILTLICVYIVQAFPQGRVKITVFKMNWKQFFNEPYEILVLVFTDQDGIMFHTYEEGRVNIHPGRIIEVLKEQCNMDIKDVATIIHNHPNPRRFTAGDNYVYNYFIDRGFRGAFMIYYPFNKKTRVKK